MLLYTNHARKKIHFEEAQVLYTTTKAFQSRQIKFLRHTGAEPTLRLKDGEPLITDNGCYIIDCRFDSVLGIGDPQVLDWLLLARAGIVEHGLFLDMAEVAYIAGDNGVEVLTRE